MGYSDCLCPFQEKKRQGPLTVSIVVFLWKLSFRIPITFGNNAGCCCRFELYHNYVVYLQLKVMSVYSTAGILKVAYS